MNIMKLYFNIVKAQWRTILLYGCIFLTFFAFFSLYTSEENKGKNYQEDKANIAIVDRDQSKASKELYAFLQKNAKIIEVGTSVEDRKDALFYGSVELIIEIPKHFEEDFVGGKSNLLTMEQRPDSLAGTMVQQKINSYLQNIYTYQSVDSTIDFQKASAMVIEDGKEKAHVEMFGGKQINFKDASLGTYFNYLSYVLFVIILLVVGLTMHSIYRSEIQKRNTISPLSSARMNMQLVVANIAFAIMIWIVFMGVVFIVNGEVLLSGKGLLYILNSFIFILMVVCMAFFFSVLLSSKRNAEDALNGITNVAGLGCSFLGGAFVPMELIPSSVLIISQFTPTYWYIKTSDLLTSSVEISGDVMIEAFQYMGVLVLFGIVFLTLGLAIMKSKQSSNAIVNTSDKY